MRETLLADFGWKFHLGDIPFTVALEHGGLNGTYTLTKAGIMTGAAAPAYDDRAWPTIDLPHDWMVSQPFDSQGAVSNSYLPRGIAWYRKSFLLPAEDRGRYLALQFDGICRNASVWLNGHYLGNHASGYTGFDFAINDVAYFGDIPNILSIRVDASQYEGWWYEGGGIYRHVWLVKAAPLHVAKWGVFVRAQKKSGNQWQVDIDTELENDGFTAAKCEIVSEVLAPGDGKLLATVRAEQEVDAKSRATSKSQTSIENPQLWSLERPALHILRTTLRQDGQIIDKTETAFGFREIRFSADEGFFLNEKPVKIHGTCNHQDHAGVGVGLPDALQEWRIRRLKESGSNAYRCSHNAPTPELLDACDRLGMLVMDENRYLRSSPESMADLERLMKRDRNHPSVILWSLCNEEYIQGGDVGGRIAASLVARARQLDTTRPTTAALLSTAFGPGIEDQVDVVSVNYSVPCWEVLHKRHPKKALVISETTAAVSTRGIYTESATEGHCDGYDRMVCPGGITIRENELAILERPYVAGGFVWTGFDYRGEPGPFTWPATGVHLGFLDTCGFRKDSFYLYQAFWSSEPMVHVLPHWTWPGENGEPKRVVAYSNCEKVELFLNEKSMGEQVVPPSHMVEWSAPYRPGEIRVVARNQGKVFAEKKIETAGAPAAVALKVESTTIAADAEDLAIITVELEDAEGKFVPQDDRTVHFSITGPGRIIGVGNGNPSSHESDAALFRTTFSGLAQVIVRSTGATGDIMLTATSEGLTKAELKIAARATQRRPFLAPISQQLLVGNWRKAIDRTKLPNPKDPDYQTQRWEAALLSYAFPNWVDTGLWLMHRGEVHVPAGSKKWRLAITRVMGQCVVFINGDRVAEFKTESAVIDVPASCAGKPMTVDIGVEGGYGGAGLYGLVWLFSV